MKRKDVLTVFAYAMKGLEFKIEPHWHSWYGQNQHFSNYWFEFMFHGKKECNTAL